MSDIEYGGAPPSSYDPFFPEQDQSGSAASKQRPTGKSDFVPNMDDEDVF